MFAKWRKYCILARAQLKVLDDYCPWTDKRSLDGVPKISRVYELLDLGYITAELGRWRSFG